MGEFEKFTMASRATRRRIARSVTARRVSAILAGLVVAVVGVFFAWDVGAPILEQNWNLAGNASTFPEVKSDENTPPKVAKGEAFNVLVMGVDRRPPGQRTEESSGSRSDVLILARIYPESGDIRMVSIPRDLLVQISPEREGKINSAYSEGGPRLAVDVVENYTQVSIDHRVVVNFKGFKKVIDSMGGVRMDVEEGLPNNAGLQSGVHNLNGAQVLFYARYRGTEGGDLDRMDRQRKVVAALRSQMMKPGTIARLPGVVKTLDENIKTDLGFDQTLTLAKALASRGQGTQLRSTKLQGTPETLDSGEEVLVPDAAANEEILEDFRR